MFAEKHRALFDSLHIMRVHMIVLLRFWGKPHIRKHVYIHIYICIWYFPIIGESQYRPQYIIALILGMPISISLIWEIPIHCVYIYIYMYIWLLV